MVYQGSKNKIAGFIAPLIRQYLKPGMNYVEPFVGGANLIDKICWKDKYGYDVNKYLIALHKKNQTSLIPFYKPTKEQWRKHHKDYQNGKEIKDWFNGYIGFICSFNGMFYNSYGDSDLRERNMILSRYNNLIQQGDNKWYKDVTFKTADFKDLDIHNSLIYLDPPYINTTKYNKEDFNHILLWEKVKEWSKNGNIILLSEYVRPNKDWKVIWNINKRSSLNPGSTQISNEKLMLYIAEGKKEIILQHNLFGGK